MLKIIGYIFTGAVAGFINGLLGTGGGIIIIFALAFLRRELDARDRFATAIAAIFPMSMVSAGFYLKQGSFALSSATPYIFPAIIGGITGAFLLCKIKVSLLKKIFAVLVIYAGIVMVI